MKLFGRLEDGAFEFTQHHVDGMYEWPVKQFSPADEAGYAAIYPLDMNFMSGFLDLCVSVLALNAGLCARPWTCMCPSMEHKTPACARPGTCHLMRAP